MRNRVCIVFLIFFVLALSACNGQSSNGSAGHSTSYSMAGKSSNASSSIASPPVKGSVSQDSTVPSSSSSATNESASQGSGLAVTPKSNRMVIYSANMEITVQHFDKAKNAIESLVTQDGGYIVNSSFSTTSADKQSGTMTARIPEKQFHSFMSKVGKIAQTVQQSNIQGQDVTKQYVDLDARLKAKMEVKSRLNNFLNKATDSSDLLKISDQLANVEEQIEQIKGQMNYLENHSALATVTVIMSETGASLAGEKDLNLLGKLKQAFIHSLNLLTYVASGIIVFLFGYSPILIIVLLLIGVIYWIYRKRRART